jgi:hypothetical protein
MERKTYRMYNTDSVNNQIGIGKGNYIYEKLDLFIERINKKSGFGVITYTFYENNKPIEKQYVPYIETEKDIEELLNSGIFRKVNIHYIDYSQVYFYVHDDAKEKNHMDIKYVEYKDGKTEAKSIRVPRDYEEYLANKITTYRKADPRINRPFDGYTREPLPKRTWTSRMDQRKYGFPMPEPSITSLWIKDIKSLALYIKDYVLNKVGLSQNEVEFENTSEDSIRRAR